MRCRTAASLACTIIIIGAGASVPFLLPGRRLAAGRDQLRAELDEEDRRVERMPALRDAPASGDLLDRLAPLLGDPGPIASSDATTERILDRHIVTPLENGRLHAFPRRLASTREAARAKTPALRDALAAETVRAGSPAYNRIGDETRRLRARAYADALRVHAYATFLEGDAEEAARLWADSVRIGQVVSRRICRDRAIDTPHRLDSALLLSCVAALRDDAALARIERELALLEEGAPRPADLARRERLRASLWLFNTERATPAEAARHLSYWTPIDRAFRSIEQELDMHGRPGPAPPAFTAEAAKSFESAYSAVHDWCKHSADLRALASASRANARS